MVRFSANSLIAYGEKEGHIVPKSIILPPISPFLVLGNLQCPPPIAISSYETCPKPTTPKARRPTHTR